VVAAAAAVATPAVAPDAPVTAAAARNLRRFSAVGFFLDIVLS
jgi:hypothetical protein